MKQCKKCSNKNIIYVENYSHLDFNTEDFTKDSGWLCLDCECFHLEDGSYEFFATISDNINSNITTLEYA